MVLPLAVSETGSKLSATNAPDPATFAAFPAVPAALCF
jgi:hypothetical protein